jgi:CRP-like cAMP-binding protein
MVVSGRIKLHQVTIDGAQTFLRVIGPGQILAIVSTLSASTYPATATAERETTVLSWNGKLLDKLFLEIPHLCRNALAVLSSRVQEMQLRFGELAAERTERRLARALLRLANQVGRKQAEGVVLDLSLSRQDLAEMVGTTLFSVSRILGDWQRHQWVQIGRQKVVLLDHPALVRLAEEEA